jgi:hypothetical protein
MFLFLFFPLMQKRGSSPKSAFKIRFCKLGATELMYFKKESDSKAAGIILLRGVLSVSFSVTAQG